jgi:magnesium transporter
MFYQYHTTEVNDKLRKLLQTQYQIKDLDIEDIFTDTQLSKIESRPSYLYTALHFLEHNPKTSHFEVKEVHCLISDSYLLTINKHKYSQLINFVKTSKTLAEEYLTPIDLYYEMLDIFVTSMFSSLTFFYVEIQEMEKELFDFETNFDFLREILVVKRNLVKFRSVLGPLSQAIEELQSKDRVIGDKGKEKLDDSLDKIKKILNTIETLISEVELLSDTNESLLSRSTNQIVKVLTSFSIIAIPATFLTGFFGMNVRYGWEEQSIWPLTLVSGGILLVTTSLYLYFKKKKWI